MPGDFCIIIIILLLLLKRLPETDETHARLCASPTNSRQVPCDRSAVSRRQRQPIPTSVFVYKASAVTRYLHAIVYTVFKLIQICFRNKLFLF